MSPYTTPAEKVGIADAWGVTHVMINEDVPPGLMLKYWTLDPDVAAQTLRTFRNIDGAFEVVASSGSITLFRRGPGEAPRERVAVPVVTAPPREARAIGARAGRATLVAVRVGASHVARGGTFDVDLYWRRDEPARPGNYVVVLRLDDADLTLPWGGGPTPKVARKIKERIEGVRYRHRDSHIFQRGFYGPDRWPAGAIVRDRATVEVPQNLAPGRYVLRAKLMYLPAAPNTDLGSYFRDDDMYSGVEIGHVEIDAD
jgi:hypothetical protein